MGEGKAFIVAGVEEEIDPMLDPVLNKEITKKGRSRYIVISDKQCEYMESFTMYARGEERRGDRFPRPCVVCGVWCAECGAWCVQMWLFLSC